MPGGVGRTRSSDDFVESGILSNRIVRSDLVSPDDRRSYRLQELAFQRAVANEALRPRFWEWARAVSFAAALTVGAPNVTNAACVETMQGVLDSVEAARDTNCPGIGAIIRETVLDPETGIRFELATCVGELLASRNYDPRVGDEVIIGHCSPPERVYRVDEWAERKSSETEAVDR